MEAEIYSHTAEVLACLRERAEWPSRTISGGILHPLGMDATHLRGSPASECHGPLDDLLLFARELQAPSFVAPETFQEATQTVFPGLVGVLPGFGRQDPMDWGLGFELKDAKSPHWTGTRNSPRTFGHFGGSGTFLWVDPERSLATACLTDREFDDWRSSWPAFRRVCPNLLVRKIGRTISSKVRRSQLAPTARRLPLTVAVRGTSMTSPTSPK